MSRKSVAVVMGSLSDLRVMEHSFKILDELEIGYDKFVISAHRTPMRMFEFARSAESRYSVIIAGAGGAAHLPGMIASLTWIPVIGVPVDSEFLRGMDSLLSIVQMPGGVPVSCMSIGKGGAKNAGLVAASILAINDEAIRGSLKSFRDRQTAEVKMEINSELKDF